MFMFMVLRPEPPPYMYTNTSKQGKIVKLIYVRHVFVLSLYKSPTEKIFRWIWRTSEWNCETYIS